MTTISAIVPTFQRAGLLVEALRSLFAQDRPVHEIVVWDDGSTDDTGAAVEGLKAEAPVPLRYFRAENAGKSRALNRAMAETTGEAIWICDDDDRCRPGAARLLAAALETAPVAGGSYRRFGLDQETGAAVDADPGYWPDLAEGSMLRHLLEDIFIFQNATLATRQAYDRVGPFREDLPRSIDYDMIVRLAARFPVAFVDAVLFDQRKHDGARGAQAARHAARDSETVWLANDQAVFLGFRETLPLGLYEAMFETAEPALASRAALIQRGAVHARRGLWALALEDIEAAAAMTDAGPLSRVEAGACRRAFAGKHGCRDAYAPALAPRFAALAAAAPLGAGIAGALGAGLRWRLREAITRRALGEAASILGLARHLKALARLSPLDRPPGEDGRIAERRVLPAEAYAW